MAKMNKSGKFCQEHGGTVGMYDRMRLCDTCSIQNHTPCKCGGNARSFGEALFQVTGCEQCDEFVSGVDLRESTRVLWNEGYRGNLEGHYNIRSPATT